MSIEQLTQFFGWCSVINIGVLIVTTIALVAFKGAVSKVHTRMTGVPEAALSGLYFQYLGFYKIAVIVFNLVPYVALKMMA